MEESTMKKHVSFVAALHIGLGIIGIFGAIGIFFIFNFARSFVVDVDVANIILRFLGIFLPFAIMTVAVFELIGGIGLLSFTKWSRTLILIVSAIGCVNVPLGTLVGIYSIWVLMQDESVKLFT
jgi:hypothetical protein